MTELTPVSSARARAAAAYSPAGNLEANAGVEFSPW